MKIITYLTLVSLCLSSSLISCQKDITPEDINPNDTIPNIPTDTGLLAHYRFTGNANDSSGHNKHGVMMNGTSYTTDALGRVNRAAYFDGIDDWIKIVDSTNYFAPSKMTVSFQFNLRDVNTRSSMFSKTNFTTPSGVVWGAGISLDNSPRLEYVEGNPTGDCATIWGTGATPSVIRYEQDLEPNRWYHAALTFEAGSQKVYIDGRLVSSTATTFMDQLQCAGADLKIGAWWQNDIVSIQGALDEIRIYGRVLSLAEIKVLAAEITDLKRGLIAYYPFTGNANDSSGNNKHGDALNGLAYSTDVLNRANSAANFDGIDDYVNITDATNYFARDVMTASFLVNLRDINTRSAFITKSAFTTPSAVSWGVGIEFDNTAKMGFTVANGPNDCSAVWNTPGGSGTQIQTVSPLQNNKWYHVTIVYDEGVQKLYLNGVLEDTHTDAWGFLNQCSNANMRLGGWWQNDIISIQGKMDEVRFYDRVLTPAEISLLTMQVE